MPTAQRLRGGRRPAHQEIRFNVDTDILFNAHIERKNDRLVVISVETSPRYVLVVRGLWLNPDIQRFE